MKMPYPIQSTRREPVRGAHAVHAMIVTAAGFALAWIVTWVACEVQFFIR